MIGMLEGMQGKIHMDRRGPWQGVVQLAGGGAGGASYRLIAVSGQRHVNRAVHGDTVAVRLLPRCPLRHCIRLRSVMCFDVLNWHLLIFTHRPIRMSL